MTDPFRKADCRSVQGHRLVVLADGDLQLTIAPDSGAEMSGLQVRTSVGPIELLYRANNFSPSRGWRGRAPLLWPAVGRTYTPGFLEQLRRGQVSPREGEYVLDGRPWPMPIHGFAMRKPWRLLDVRTDDQGVHAAFELTDDPHTRQCYPFGFRLAADYSLTGRRVVASYTVAAAATNESAMPFTIGNHLTFRVPWSDERATDYVLNMPAGEILTQTAECLPDGGREAIDLPSGVRLDDPRIGEAIIAGFPADDCHAELRSPAGLAVRLEQRIVAPPGCDGLAGPAGLVFVLYRDPEGRFFCVEPWCGLPNALNSGQGLIRLPPGQGIAWRFSLVVAS